MRLTPPQQEGSSGVAGPGAESIRRLAWALAVSRGEPPVESIPTPGTGRTDRRSRGDPNEQGGDDPVESPETPCSERSDCHDREPDGTRARTGQADRTSEGATPEILTDGGRTLQAESIDGGADDEREAEETEEGGYRSLFLDVAGTTELVDEQEEQDVSRDVDDDTASLSSYVASVAKEDGLVDTIDEPESGSAD